MGVGQTAIADRVCPATPELQIAGQTDPGFLNIAIVTSDRNLLAPQARIISQKRIFDHRGGQVDRMIEPFEHRRADDLAIGEPGKGKVMRRT